MTRVVAIGCAALAIVVVALFAFAAAVPGNIDDAFIVLVYARHLLRDGQLYWNEADGPVEGFSSPLDLIVKTIGSAVRPDDPLQAAFWSSLLLHGLCPLLMFGLALRLRHEGDELWRWVVALAAGLAVAASRNLAFGSSFLLETPLFVASALGVLWLMGRPRDNCTSARLCAVPLLLAALFWSRPEGLPVGVLSLAFFLWHQRRSTSRKTLTLVAASVAAIVATLVLWRLAYFGEWAPNTYYAKSSSSQWNEISDGLLYVWAARKSNANVIVLGAIAIGWVLLLFRSAWNREGRAIYFHAWSLAAVSVLSVVWGGGDSYAGGRFLALPSCLAIFLLAVGSHFLRHHLRWLTLAPLILLVCFEVNDVRGSIPFARQRMRSWPTSVHQFSCEAQAMRRVAAVDSSLAVAQSDCQRFKFFSDATRVIDLHGLNDRRIAHQPAPGRVVWGRYSIRLGLSVGAPVWVWGYAWWSDRPMAATPLSQIVASDGLARQFAGYFSAPGKEAAERMVRDYATASVRACGRYFNFLLRKEHAKKFRQAGILVGTRKPSRPSRSRRSAPSRPAVL